MYQSLSTSAIRRPSWRILSVAVCVTLLLCILTSVCRLGSRQHGPSDTQQNLAPPPPLPNPTGAIYNKIDLSITPARYAGKDLLIGILTSDSTFYRAVAQFNTWIQRLPTGVSVNIYVAQFAPTSFTDIQFPELWPKDNLHPTTHTPLAFPTPVVNLDVPELHNHLVVRKTFAALRHMYEKHPQKKWYMKADDDTQVFGNNLLHSLQSLDSTTPVYMGKTLNFPDCCGGHNSGGSGWILSHRALEMIYPHLDSCIAPYLDPVTLNEISWGEDQILWECLKRHVPGIVTTDNEGQYMSKPDEVFGLYKSLAREGPVQRPITLHWISWEWFFALDWLVFGAVYN